MHKNDNSETGIIYAAFGERYIFETLISIKSLLSYQKNIPITVFTDKYDRRFPECVSLKICENTKDYLVKINAMQNTPYAQTLFLDTDTFFTRELSTSIFNYLNQADICASLEVGRPSWKNTKLLNDAFTEINTGVVLFAKNKRTKQFFVEWRKQYSQRKKLDFHDQTSGTLALFTSECRFFPLANNINFRFVHPQTVDGDVTILHGRARDLRYVAYQVNKHSSLRNWSSTKMRCNLANEKTFLQFIKNYLKKILPLNIIKIIRGKNTNYYETEEKRFVDK